MAAACSGLKGHRGARADDDASQEPGMQRGKSRLGRVWGWEILWGWTDLDQRPVVRLRMLNCAVPRNNVDQDEEDEGEGEGDEVQRRPDEWLGRGLRPLGEGRQGLVDVGRVVCFPSAARRRLW